MYISFIELMTELNNNLAAQDQPDKAQRNNSYSPLENLKDDRVGQQGATIQQKKRKHHRRQKIVRGPEQIKELRLERIKIKRQICWDTRFIKDTIPDLFTQKPKRNVFKVHKPLQSVYVEKQRPRFLNLQKQRMKNTVSTNKRKSFKIRQIRKQVGQKSKEKAKIQEKILENENQNQRKKINRKIKNKEKLLQKLQQKIKVNPINNKYKQILIDIIQRSTHKRHKSVRSIVQKQIDSIGTDDNVYSKLEKMIQYRRQMLQIIKQCDKQNITLKSCLDLQIHSLLLIEEILKFKSFWQTIYSDTLHHPSKVNFYYQDSNYLADTNKQVQDIAQNDPFLVEMTAKLQPKGITEKNDEEIRQKKEMILKIRACELLLIEEELLSNQ